MELENVPGCGEECCHAMQSRFSKILLDKGRTKV